MIEVWLRGPLPTTPTLVQPVAHALMQAREEVHAYAENVSPAQLWLKPAGAASVGFHLQHLSGVLDRLFTYARGEGISETQLETFHAEGKPDDALTLANLLETFDKTVDKALETLEKVDTSELTEKREVGRAKLPTTLLGLYTHAAEHTMRHVGQLLVTTKVLAQMAEAARPALTIFTVDRFDDNDLAILESPEQSLMIPKQFLPSGTNEGDVVRLEQRQGEVETQLHFNLDPEAKEATLEAIRDLRAKLKRGPDGDIAL